MPRAGMRQVCTAYPLIYEAAPEDDIYDERTWKKANPSLGAFRSIKEMREMAERARVLPSQETAFRRLYLNQWVQADTKWIKRETWSACEGKLPELLGRKCYAGLDLSSTEDFTALVLVFPMDDNETFCVLPFFWVPESKTPWLVRIEQAMRTTLLTRDERSRYVIEHDTANFLRGDTQSRMQAYATAVQAGIMTPNECRVRDNLAPVEGGDELLRPLNMTTAGSGAGTENGKRAFAGKRDFIFGTERRSSQGNDNAALREAFADWFREQAGDILRLAERILGERDENANRRLLEALNEYYDSIELSDDMRSEAGKIAAEAFAEADRALEDIDAKVPERTEEWTAGYLTRYNEECSERIATANLDDVKRIIKAGGDTVKKLTERLEKWPEQRAKYMADTERAFITNEAKMAEYRRCGYDSVWVSGAGCCKACTDLNGITLKGSFRPPLHGGCTCTVGIGKCIGVLNNDKIAKGVSYNDDPIREYIGSAYESNPSETKDIEEKLNNIGVEIQRRANTMAYSPGYKGKPGTLIIDENASYSALLHEFTHAMDDHESGWSGFGLLGEPKKMIEWENHAYDREIDLAESMGYNDVVEKLRVLKAEREEQIRNEYGLD